MIAHPLIRLIAHFVSRETVGSPPCKQQDTNQRFTLYSKNIWALLFCFTQNMAGYQLSP